MGKRIWTILLAVALGTILGSAAVVFLSYRSHSVQLVDGYPLRYWVKCLAGGDEAQRKPAVTSLPKFGNAAVDPLIELLANPKVATREAAGRCLFAIGPSVIPALNNALRDPSARRRISAIDTLTLFGPASLPAAPNVARLLADSACGPAATQFFLNTSVTTDAIGASAELVDVGDVSRRLDAIRVLRKAPTDDPTAVEALVRALHGGDPAVKDAAFLALYDHPKIVPAIVPDIVAALERDQTTQAARVLLVGLGRAGIDPLMSLADSPTPDVRQFAVTALTRLRPHDLAIGRALRCFLKDPMPDIVTEASGPFIRILSAEPELRQESLAGRNPRERILALRALESVIPSRIDDAAGLLDDPDESVRRQAQDTLRLMGAGEDMRTQRIAHSDDPRERARGIRLVSLTRGWWNVDLATTAADDPDLNVRRAAIESLGRAPFSDRAKERLLVALANDPSSTIRADAAEALLPWRDLGRVESALEAAQSDPDPAVRVVAKETLDRKRAVRR